MSCPRSLPTVTDPRLADAFAPLLAILRLLDDIDVRLGGGWGIDVLAGRVTRDHHDVDLFVADLPATLSRLVDAGFTPTLEEPPHRMVLSAPGSCAPFFGTLTDVNGLMYRPCGDALQRDPRGEIEIFGAWAWTDCQLGGRRVVCLNAEAQRLKHRGYPSRPQDEADLAAIAHIAAPARFDPSIRAAEPGDEDIIEGIEITSDMRYESLGLWPLPPPPPVRRVVEAARTRCTLVAGRPAVGFCRVEVVDGHAHIGQVSVVPEVGGLGIGTELVEEACRWATQEGYGAVTLTTFTDPPFNAPWYRRLGFVPVDPPYGPELSEVVAGEADLAALGPRVVMVRRVGPRDPADRI